MRECCWDALTEAERAGALVRGEQVYAEYGDDVAKPRLEAVLRRERRRTTGSCTGFVGNLTILPMNGPLAGSGMTLSGEQYYAGSIGNPRSTGGCRTRSGMRRRAGGWMPASCSWCAIRSRPARVVGSARPPWRSTAASDGMGRLSIRKMGARFTGRRRRREHEYLPEAEYAMSHDTSGAAPAFRVGLDADVLVAHEHRLGLTAAPTTCGRGSAQATPARVVAPSGPGPVLAGGTPDKMDVTFVGGLWHGETRPCPKPLPPRIGAPHYTIYVPWTSHPATAGIHGDLLEHTPTYVVAALGARDLQKRVEDLLLHMSEGRKS